MTDQNQDSGSADGNDGSPNSSASQSAGDQQSSGFDAVKLQSALEALTKKLDEVDARSRSLQGEKDRGVNKTRKEVEELKRQIGAYEKLKESGLDLDTAVEEIDFRDTVRQLKDQISSLNPPPAQTTGSSSDGADHTAWALQELTKYDLSSNDSAFIEILRGTPSRERVKDYILGKVAPQPAASPAGIVQAAATGGSKGSDTPDKIARLAELQKRPSLHRDEIKTLVTELEARGWK